MNLPLRSLASAVVVVAVLQAFAVAQPPGPPPGGRGPGNRPPGGPGGPGMQGERTQTTAEDFIKRLLSLDADGDGKLAKSEVGDARLHPLLTRVDADGNGVATQDEMRALFAKESAELARSRSMRGGPGGGMRGGPPGGPPGGPRPNGGGGPEGPGGRGAPPDRPGGSNLPAGGGNRPGGGAEAPAQPR